MNLILSFVVLYSMSVNVIYGQYYPHRKPVQPKAYVSSANPENPFQRAHENQGYYQKFTDYGSLKAKPLTKVKQNQNTYSSDSNRGKGEENYDNYEDDTEFDFGSHFDYNDVTNDKEFDPFKFVSDGVAGADSYGDLGGVGDNSDYNYYNSE